MRHRVQHRRRWILVSSLAGLLAIGGAVFVIVWRSTGAHEVSIEQAQRRFRGSSSTLPEAPRVLRPPAGVYRYTGSGTEHLSLPPKSMRQGPEMPATVTHRADGCWVIRIDYSSNHWQSWTYCPRDDGLVEIGGQTFEKWDFVFTTVDAVATFECSSSDVIRAAMRPGDRWEQRCTGTNTGVSGRTVSAGTFTYVGDETLDIGGTRVPAYHFHAERTLSDAQTGKQTSDVWFAQADGMPLRNTRENIVKSDSPFGTIDYTERGEFTLSSLTPQR